MPSTIPGYMYSLFAALLVGMLAVYACNVAAVNIRADADRQQLENIADYVATESLMLLSRDIGCQNITQTLELPSQVGNQRYWLRIANDSYTGWVEAGLGAEPVGTALQVEIPAAFSASGTYISGVGHPALVCQFENQNASLTLTLE